MSQIQIYARVRPTRVPFQGLHILPDNNSIGIDIGDFDNVSKTPQSTCYAHAPPSRHHFKFSHVFDQEASQEDIFNIVAVHMIESFFNGYNGTIFAYGQTSSGKTHTIEGNSRKYSERGLIPRIISSIFEEMERRNEMNQEVSVEISYMEIYQDVGYDLLNAGTRPGALMVVLPKVHVVDSHGGEVRVRNLSLHLAASEKVALSLLFQGSTCRKVAETSMNQCSSRSHTIFTIHLTIKSPNDEVIIKSKLNLVDLAGSERVAKTGANGQLLQEAKYINLSLHHLEHVIITLQKLNHSSLSPRARPRSHCSSIRKSPRTSPKRPKSHSSSTRSLRSSWSCNTGGINPLALSGGGQKGVHVPYRNSMLTMVLKDSLGGNCLTAMIATISAEERNIWESISTCRFSQRVACVSNLARRNEELDDKVVIRKLKQKIAELEAEIHEIRSMKKQEIDYIETDIKRPPSNNYSLSPDDQRLCHQILYQFFHGQVDSPVQAGIDTPAKFQECLLVLRNIVIHALQTRKNQNSSTSSSSSDGIDSSSSERQQSQREKAVQQISQTPSSSTSAVVDWESETPLPPVREEQHPPPPVKEEPSKRGRIHPAKRETPPERSFAPQREEIRPLYQESGSVISKNDGGITPLSRRLPYLIEKRGHHQSGSGVSPSSVSSGFGSMQDEGSSVTLGTLENGQQQPSTEQSNGFKYNTDHRREDLRNSTTYGQQPSTKQSNGFTDHRRGEDLRNSTYETQTEKQDDVDVATSKNGIIRDPPRTHEAWATPPSVRVKRNIVSWESERLDGQQQQRKTISPRKKEGFQRPEESRRSGEMQQRKMISPREKEVSQRPEESRRSGEMQQRKMISSREKEVSQRPEERRRSGEIRAHRKMISPREKEVSQRPAESRHSGEMRRRKMEEEAFKRLIAKREELRVSWEEEQKLEAKVEILKLRSSEERLMNELSEVKEKLAGQHARVRLFEKKGLDEEVIVAERIVEQHLRIKMHKVNQKLMGIKNQLKAMEGVSEESSPLASSGNSTRRETPVSVTPKHSQRVSSRNTTKQLEKYESHVQKQIEMVQATKMDKDLELKEAATRLKIQALKQQLLLDHTPTTAIHTIQDPQRIDISPKFEKEKNIRMPEFTGAVDRVHPRTRSDGSLSGLTQTVQQRSSLKQMPSSTPRYSHTSPHLKATVSLHTSPVAKHSNPSGRGQVDMSVMTSPTFQHVQNMPAASTKSKGSPSHSLRVISLESDSSLCQSSFSSLGTHHSNEIESPHNEKGDQTDKISPLNSNRTSSLSNQKTGLDYHTSGHIMSNLVQQDLTSTSHIQLVTMSSHTINKLHKNDTGTQMSTATPPTKEGPQPPSPTSTPQAPSKRWPREKLTLPKMVKETEYMTAVERQKVRVAKIRRCMVAATVIQRAWRHHKASHAS